MMSVIIPDDILQSARMSEAELKLEIAILLFHQDKISIGKARHLAGMSLLEFQKEIAGRGICIHYDVEEFEEDIKILRSLGRI
jgi:predicted HTH domain antitoxin